jgi:small-conductance mechanosensitive channel
MKTIVHEINPTSRTINSRICFANKINKLGLLDFEAEEIIVLPNYKVKGDKINPETFLPKEMEIKLSVKNQEITKKLKSLNLQIEEIPNCNEFRNAINSTGQLIVFEIYHDKNGDYIYKNSRYFFCS